MIELARVLANFLDYIGGKSHATKLFKILELLLILDETSVRNEALISIKTILSYVNPSDHEKDLIDLINRLNSSEYSNQKIAAINLTPTVFKYFNSGNKLALIK